MVRDRAPRWLTLKWGSPCNGCGADLRKGERAYYFPLTSSFHGAQCGCGEKEERFQLDQQHDEDEYERQYGSNP